MLYPHDPICERTHGFLLLRLCPGGAARQLPAAGRNRFLFRCFVKLFPPLRITAAHLSYICLTSLSYRPLIILYHESHPPYSSDEIIELHVQTPLNTVCRVLSVYFDSGRYNLYVVRLFSQLAYDRALRLYGRERRYEGPDNLYQ